MLVSALLVLQVHQEATKREAQVECGTVRMLAL